MWEIIIDSNYISKVKLGDTNVGKVYKGDNQIWPRIQVANYHMMRDFTNWSAPSWWSCTSTSFTSEWVKATGSNVWVMEFSLPSAALNSLRNAQYVEFLVHYFWETDSSQIRVQLLNPNEVYPVLWFNFGSDWWYVRYRVASQSFSSYDTWAYGHNVSRIALDLIHPYQWYSDGRKLLYQCIYNVWWRWERATYEDAVKLRWATTLEARIKWDCYIKSIELISISTNPAMAPWIYWNDSMLWWMLSMSDNWYQWISIADKNLWASSVYRSWTPRDSTAWYFYQWWNNYWHSHWWVDNPTDKLIWYAADIPSHWPGNYFRYPAFSWVGQCTWSKEYNYNLWWDTTDTSAWRQWPCDSWFHIPSVYEAMKFRFYWRSLIYRRQWHSGLSDDDLFAPTWYYEGGDWSYRSTSTFWRTSTPFKQIDLSYGWEARGLSIGDDSVGRERICNNSGVHIRPFANASYYPNASYWTPLYQASY